MFFIIGKIKMNNKKLILIFNILLISISFSCSNSVGPEFLKQPYVSLTVGDERQFIFTTDSSTIYYKITNELFRSDGLKIFSYEWYYGTDTVPFIQYYSIKDSFFISTEKDTVRDSIYYLPQNPFFEQKLAKLYPNDGERWQSIPGDSLSVYFTAKNIGTQKTPAGIFNNCFSFTLDNFLSVNYAEGVGHIASIVLSDSIGIISSYLKVNNKVYGEKLPAKDPIFPRNNLRLQPERFFNYLLGHY